MAEPPSDDDSSSAAIVAVAKDGDVVLDVTFQTSRETLRLTRKTTAAPGGARQLPSNAPPTLRPSLTVAFRVRLATLQRESKYFANLLGNEQFAEAGRIAAAHAELAESGVDPGAAHAGQLPRVAITDDDEATQSAGREHAFEDMLRLVHGKPPRAAQVAMPHVVTLAIMADRFDCLGAVARAALREFKYKWPMPAARPLPAKSPGTGAVDVEQIQRQKVLVAWLLGMPNRLQQACRELIMQGSRLWSPYADVDMADKTQYWWALPDGLEQELQYRRECVLNTVASIQKHFLNLYLSKERQCKLGYDSSGACDSFQLGQMIKFLTSKKLAFLVDFSPSSLDDDVADSSRLDIDQLLQALRQAPNYQIDKHHTNCGLRIRIDPILDYVSAMLSASVVSISLAEWRKNRADVSWAQAENESRHGAGKTFLFTRALANDQRLRFEGHMYANKMARELFTASAWDWTPEL
ncbi:hypothetical protein B0I35DRAFT_477715 [Stachybotrys elegans]|uniref:Uncharacterized protein n=1 Tax=Stachybotrys elegans TaxID=80388 RepID=A0A8K0SUI2_9HYPO|nr:hypothetical protein B0I35DRAFT_477715 [Stachybotrys elegans]